MDRVTTWLGLLVVPLTGVPGVLGAGAELLAGLVAAAIATRPGLRAIEPPRRWLVVALWALVVADLPGTAAGGLGRAVELASLLLVIAAGVSAVRVLGRTHAGPLLRDSAFAATCIVLLNVGGTDPARTADLAMLGLLVVAAMTWSQVAIVRRSVGTGARLLGIAVACATVGAVVTFVVTSPVGVGVGVVLANASQLAFALVLAHRDAAGLFREVDGDGDGDVTTVVGARAVSAVGVLLVVGVQSRVHELTGAPVAAWQVVLPAAVLVWVAVRIHRLHRVMVAVAEDLRGSTLRDPTTGLLNEQGLVDRQRTTASSSVAVLMVVELDGLRAVLRRSDPSAAVELLRTVARRLEHAAGLHGVVARTETDEFVVVAGADPTVMGRRVLRTLADTLDVPAIAVSVRVGVRVGWSTVEASAPELALAEARFAAHDASHGQVIAFTDEQRERYRTQRTLVRDFPAALRRGQIQPHYQPIVDMVTGRISAFEVLARWRHPDLGDVSPDVFIPLAESSGAVVQLGELMLSRACAQLARWRELPGRADLGVTVNISPRHLVEGDLEHAVTRALSDAGLPGSALTLELTEAVLADLESRGHVLRDLRAVGVRVAVDDFGTGYSSLAYLDRLRPDVVKVDRRFTHSLGTERPAVARGLFELLTQLEFPVVAEGVEDTSTLEVLRDLGVERWQGFLLSPAVAEEDATALLTDGPAPVPSSARDTSRVIAESRITGQDVTVAAFVAPAVVVDDGWTWRDVEKLFVESEGLRTVVVRRADGGFTTLAVRDVHTRMTGPYGFGRSLHAGRPLRDGLGSPTRPLPVDTAVVDAVAIAMARPAATRYGDLLVVDGDRVGLVVVSSLLAELANDLGQLAVRDDLTGLPNRRHFLSTVERWLADGAPVGVLFLDLDGFKPINDALGHAAGDAVLVAVARRLRAAARGVDVVARLGGDEFAIAVNDPAAGTMHTIADRVVTLLGSPVAAGDEDVVVAASVGVARGAWRDADALIAAADASMYEAKRDPRTAVGPLVTPTTAPTGPARTVVEGGRTDGRGSSVHSAPGT